MTLYRDDIQETIAYSNNTIGRSKAVTEELMRVREDMLHQLKVLSADAIQVSDELIDSAIFPIKDSVSVTDTLVGRKRHVDLIHEQIVVSDNLKTRLRAKSLVQDEISSASTSKDKQSNISIEKLQIIETLNSKKHSVLQQNDALKVKDNFKTVGRFKDSISEKTQILDISAKLKLRSFLIDSISYTDKHIHKKKSHSIVTERISATDTFKAKFTDIVIEQVVCAEKYMQRTAAKQRVIDTLGIEEALKQQRKAKDQVNESLALSEIAKGKNIAKQTVQDLIFVEDDYSAERKYGYAWTANVDTWAMSRYQDYGFSELVVIDSVLYGVAEDGVYRLDANTFVDAKLTTGQLDLGQGSLVHPLGAYLEYELSGSSKRLEIGVSTTQTGTKQTYYYLLPAENSDYLTNGRVLFGRGLRGRHFAFEIKISGEHGYINDLSIDMTATKRRV